jgi:hypothetical protein
MDKSIEALRLAKILENIEGYRVTMTAAHELRRLHEENKKLKEALAEHAMREVQRLGQEIEQCQCPECQIKPHASDCAVHSEPAYPKGKCDCGAQPEQEQEQKIGCVNHDCDQCKAQPEQEPVAWMDKYGEIYKDVPEVLSTDKPLYTTPPQRTWVGLPDEEIKTIEEMALTKRMAIEMAIAIVKEKNT